MPLVRVGLATEVEYWSLNSAAGSASKIVLIWVLYENYTNNRAEMISIFYPKRYKKFDPIRGFT